MGTFASLQTKKMFSRVVAPLRPLAARAAVRPVFAFTRFFSSETQERLSGVCKWFNSEKGYGFITPSDNGNDVFVHQSGINCDGFRSIAEAAQVEYEIIEENGRLKAVNVTGPNGSPIEKDQSRPRPSGGDYYGNNNNRYGNNNNNNRY